MQAIKQKTKCPNRTNYFYSQKFNSYINIISLKFIKYVHFINFNNTQVYTIHFLVVITKASKQILINLVYEVSKKSREKFIKISSDKVTHQEYNNH